MSKYENFFMDLKNTTPYFKCAAEGAAGSGKTYSLAQIAVGLHQFIKSDKPIVIFDTEKSAKFLRPYFEQNNIKVLLKDSRTLSDLTDTMDYCDAGNADILIIDSITHVWEGFLNAYQEKKGRSYLQFQDWGQIKPTWRREYSDRLVMGKYHILFTGREGFTYEHETNEDTGKKELIKTGVKMKVEGDTAYEPDLLLRMERFEEILGNGKPKKVWREATIIKDRSTLIDGKTFNNPTFGDVKPVIEFLLSDVHEPVETTSRTDHDLIMADENNYEEKRQKKITLEEIWGVFDKLGLGTGKDDKQRKVTILERIFMTTSKSKIEAMSLDQLIDGLDRLERDGEVIELTKKGKAA